MTDVHDKISARLEEVCEKLNWNTLYVEEYTEAAAVKAAVLFQALGYDYGDRTPGVYNLQDTITECVIGEGQAILLHPRKKPEGRLYCSTGMLTVQAYWEDWDDNGDGQWQIEIFFDLINFAEHRVIDEE